MPLIPGVERIAILRGNGIGDLVFALPALEALRAAYPRARITLLGREWHAELFDGRPGPVDEVVPVPPWRGIREEKEDPGQVEEFFAAMRLREFDLALQLHGGGRNSNPFISRLGATTTAGLRAPGAPTLDLEFPYFYYQHEVMRLLEVVALVGATPVELEPRLKVTERDREQFRSFLSPKMGSIDEGKPLVALNPGAGDTRRRWPAAKFGAVGDALAQTGYRVVVTGSAKDQALALEVARSMQAEPLIAAGRLRLGGLLGLFENCRVVVSNDSGPLHLAAAVGAPSVGIFWCGNLINAGPLFRARQRPLLSWRLKCPVCGVDCTRGECDHGGSFVADVQVAEVTEAAFDLVALSVTGRKGPDSNPVALGSAELQQQSRGSGHDD